MTRLNDDSVVQNHQGRRQLHKTLLQIVAEYRRVQSILSRRRDVIGGGSMTRLQQAMLCGFVPSAAHDRTNLQQSKNSGSEEYESLLAIGLDRFDRLLEQGPWAREKLITMNIGLVHHVVESVLSSYYHVPLQKLATGKQPTKTMDKGGKRLLYSLTKQDLIQEGTIGLARAIDKYDASYSSSATFSTYAYYWIRASVLRAIAQKDELVRVPEHVSSAITKIVRAANRIGLSKSLDSSQALEHDMLRQLYSLSNSIPSNLYTSGETRKWEEAETAKRLADEAGVSLTLLKDALTVQHRRQVSQTLGGTLVLEPWMMPTITSPSSQDNIYNTNIHDGEDTQYLRDTLSQFVNSKEMEALSLRYGLIRPKQPIGFRDYEEEAERDLFGDLVAVSPASTKNDNNMESDPRLRPTLSDATPVGGRWGEAMSFNEIGKQMQVSAEYGRRLCSSALKKLKQAADEGRLDPGLLYI
jgi:RNA polymerase sigma factor (sigma-70 family)